MTGEERARIVSEEYIDLIVDNRNLPHLVNEYEDVTVHVMNDLYAILHIPASILETGLANIEYYSLPMIFGLTDVNAIDASRINDLRAIPTLDLRGQGVLVGIVDTGIDYTNPVFIHENGTTKIAAIWDQTIETGISPPDAMFGSVYTMEEINLALMSTAPFDIVPSMDENGHGTMMAGIVAGNEVPEANFSGVVPDAELIVVKLRQAKRVLRDFYVIPEASIAFQENTIMWGVQYCLQVARRLGRPLVVCLGIGSAQGGHDGRSPLPNLLNIFGAFRDTVIVTAVGNEANKGRHYLGIADPAAGSSTVELNVSEDERGFTMELWGASPGIFSIDILSPSGEYIPRIPVSLRVHRVISFIFERTVIDVDYQTVEAATGDQLIMLRFRNVTPGTWVFNVYGQGDLAAAFHIWLPMGDFITDNTYFLQPNIYTTLLTPSASPAPIAMTAYNPMNGNLYVNAGRGYSRADVVKPELAAPGVGYIAPTLDHSFAGYTGTSAAAAHTAGIAAIALEWGTILGNSPGMDSIEVKNFLIRGARRRANLSYPNRDWGYGIVDVFNVFDILRVDILRI